MSADLITQLRAMVEPQPPGAALMLPVDWLRGQLENMPAGIQEPGEPVCPRADGMWPIRELAALYRCSVSSMREQIAGDPENGIPGAYGKPDSEGGPRKAKAAGEGRGWLVPHHQVLRRWQLGREARAAAEPDPQTIAAAAPHARTKKRTPEPNRGRVPLTQLHRTQRLASSAGRLG